MRNRQYLHAIITDLQPSFFFFQDIWLPFCEESKMRQYLPDYEFQIVTPDMFTHPEDKICMPDQNWHGAGIAWHQSLDSCKISVKNVNERFTGIKLQIESQFIFVISAYLPTSGKDTEFLECIQELSNYVI